MKAESQVMKQSARSHPVLKVVNSDGCQSYIVGCPDTRECVIVDPKVGRESVYLAMLEHYELRLVAIFDTHTHADHLSAAPRICKRSDDLDLPLWMSAATTVDRPITQLRHGDDVTVGKLAFRVIEVPGHTPDSVALFGEGLVLTGDSLLIGGLARADFVGSNPAQLFDSVQRELMRLPDDTMVLPGHGYNDILFSTIATERRLNEQLRFTDGEAYAASLNANIGAGNSAAVNAILELNLAQSPELPKAAGNAAACCASPSGPVTVQIDEVAPEEARGIHKSLMGPEQWVDVRDPFEFAAGRIPGTVNVPLSELGFHLERLRTDGPLYLSCRSGVRSMTAAKTLQRLGVVAAPVNIGGGILGWQGQSFPIEGVPAV